MNTENFRKYLEGRNNAPKTQNFYIKFVEQFFEWVQTDYEQVTKPDVLRFLEYLKNKRKVQNAYRKNCLIALNHYFTHLYKEGKIDKNPCAYLKLRGKRPKKMYKTYTEQELETLFDNYYNVFVRNFDTSILHDKLRPLRKTERKQAQLCRERNAVILSVLTNQGAKTAEIETMQIDDVDLIKAKIKLRGGKRSNERIIPLKATQIGLFMYYLQNTRPQLLEYHTKESNKLFLTLPAISAKETEGGTLLWAFSVLTKQLKEIDRQFENVLHLRASVITNWLKTCGLRKTQYLAGHRYVSSTEKYQPNNLDALIEDINKLNPF